MRKYDIQFIILQVIKGLNNKQKKSKQKNKKKQKKQKTKKPNKKKQNKKIIKNIVLPSLINGSERL